jgi:hypothetical protein
MDWNHLAQDSDKWRALVDTVKKPSGYIKYQEFLGWLRTYTSQNKTTLQSLNFSLVSILTVTATAVLNPCYVSMQAKALIIHTVLWYSLPSLN